MYIFPATTLQIPALFATGAGELSGSNQWAGPFWPEPILRTRAFHLRTDWSDWTDRTDGKRPQFPFLSIIRPMEIDFLVRVSAHMDFFYRLKIFHCSSQISFSNNEAPESDKIGIWLCSMLKWVFRNNCNCCLVLLFHFWTILNIRRYAPCLKLWNEVPSNKFQTSVPQKLVTKDEIWWKSRTEFCFLVDANQKFHFQ